MKFSWFSTVLIASFSVAIFSCSKDDDNNNTTAVSVAGKGGTTTLHVVPQNNGVNVDSCMVYLKYNTDVVPANLNQYDDSVKCATLDNVPVAAFPNLKKGQYLVYAKGWDIVRSQTVSGSRPYSITSDNTTATLELQLQ